MSSNRTLAELTTLGVGGPAGAIAAPSSIEGLRDVVRGDGPMMVIGGGSNVLVSDDGYAGTVIQPALMGIEASDDGDSVVVRVGAGQAWDDFVSWTSNLLWFAEVAVSGIILLMIVRFFMDKLILVGDDLNREISEDRNLAAGFLEATVAVGFAAVLAVLL